MISTTGGRLIYPLDDTYIHMTVARNLAMHGQWGVNYDRFAPASSSPLWVLLLALTDRILGVHDSTPLLWSLLFALAALYQAERIWRPAVRRAGHRAVLGLLFVYLVPLVPLALSGMEHTLHLFGVLLVAEGMLAGGRDVTGKSRRLTYVGAFLATAARYETLFLIVPLVVLRLAQRRFREAGVLALFAALPVALFGLFSISRGGFFLPAPLLLKGRFPRALNVYELGLFGIHRLLRNPYLYMTFLVLLVSGILAGRNRGASWLALTTAAGMLLHLQFAGLGYLYRYDAYLVGLSLVTAGLVFASRAGKVRFRIGSAALWLLVAVWLWPLHLRARAALRDVGMAAGHIYRQQYQVARFLRRLRPQVTAVAVDDLGAVAYYSGMKVYDLLGIGDLAVARVIRSGSYDTAWIGRYLRKNSVRLVVVHPDCFTGRASLPADLRSVAYWRVRHPYWGQTVGFYARRTLARVIREALCSFEPDLPSGVSVTYRAGE